MKRYLSIIITLVMALGFSGALTVQAADDAATYPYLYLNFEDSANPGVTHANVSWSEGGAQGTSGSLYAKNYDFGINIPSGLDLMTKYPTKFSAWIKLDTTKTKLKASYDRAGFVVFGPTTTKSATWFANPSLILVDGLGLNSGEWVYMETIVTWDGKMMGDDAGYYDNDKFLAGTSCYFWPRVGDVGGGKVANAVAEDSPTQDIYYWLDDIRMEPILSNTEEEDTSVNVLKTATFDNGIESGIGSVTHSNEIGPDGNAGVAVFNSTEGSYSQLTLDNLPMKYNKLYRTTVKMKAANDETVGAKLRLIYGRSSRLDLTNDPLNRAGDYDGYEHTYADKTLTKDWQTFTFYIKRDVKTFDEKAILPMLRVGNDRAASSVLVDDIEVAEIKNPANGDFEWKKEDYVITHLKPTGNTSLTDYERYGTFFGWFEDGVTTEVSTDVDTAGGSEGTQSAKITATEANGAISQGVYLPKNEEVEIRFRAKAEGSTVGKNIQVKLDRAVEQKDAKDLYEVPDTEMLGENLTLTDEWQEFKIPYTFAVTEPSGLEANVGPRQPFLSFVIENGAMGDTYYIDDLEIGEAKVETETYDLSYVDEASVSGNCIVGETIHLDYSCVVDTKLESGTNFIRVITKDGSGSGELMDSVIADSTGSVDYVVPESVKNKEVYFDILPVTQDNRVGITKRLTVGTAKALYEVSEPTASFDTENNSATGTFTAVNNDPNGNDLKLFITVVAYDKNGRAVRMESKNVVVASGEQTTEPIKCTVSMATKEGFSEIACAKVYVWGGSSVFDTDMTPYTDVKTVTK